MVIIIFRAISAYNPHHLSPPLLIVHRIRQVVWLHLVSSHSYSHSSIEYSVKKSPHYKSKKRTNKKLKKKKKKTIG